MSKKQDKTTDKPKAEPETDAAVQVAEPQETPQAEAEAAALDPSVPHKPFADMTAEERKALAAELKTFEKNTKSLAAAEKVAIAAADQEALDVSNEAIEAAGLTVAKTRNVRLVKTTPEAAAHLEFTAGAGKREGGRDDRKALDEPDLIAAGVAEFLGDDGNPVTPYSKGDDLKPSHPRSYLDAHASEVCYFEKCCYVAAPHFEKEGKIDPNDPPTDLAQHVGKPFTDKQSADILDGIFRHKDAAARSLVKYGKRDTRHSVRMKDGSTQTVAEFITAAIAPTQDVPNPPESEPETEPAA